MNFQELQNKAVANAFAYGQKYQIEVDQDFALLKLYEEVGEYAQAILIHRKKSRPEKHLPEEQSKEKLARELADVVGVAMVNAHLFGLDLEKALQDKWLNNQ